MKQCEAPTAGGSAPYRRAEMNAALLRGPVVTLDAANAKESAANEREPIAKLYQIPDLDPALRGQR